jgi:phosphinothricin acetyltransferase
MPGEVSVALHDALGFEPAGIWRKAGYKLGQWWDVGVWQKELQAPAVSPAAVIPFSALDAAQLRAVLDAAG